MNPQPPRSRYASFSLESTSASRSISALFTKVWKFRMPRWRMTPAMSAITARLVRKNARKILNTSLNLIPNSSAPPDEGGLS